MRLPKEEHARHRWRVHTLADDFDLLDVWQYPIVADEDAGEDFAYFCAMLDAEAEAQGAPAGGAAGFLFAVRDWLGRIFHLDEEIELPIPGCEETSVHARLTAEERAESTLGPRDAMGFREVYRRDDELLKEISNKTVHALLHIGWVARDESPAQHSPQLAVYAKNRGAFGGVYMAAIAPFRHLIVYPALMRTARKSWERWREFSEESVLHRGESAALLADAQTALANDDSACDLSSDGCDSSGPPILTDSYEFPGDDIPFIRGSALKCSTGAGQPVTVGVIDDGDDTTGKFAVVFHAVTLDLQIEQKETLHLGLSLASSQNFFGVVNSHTGPFRVEFAMDRTYDYEVW